MKSLIGIAVVSTLLLCACQQPAPAKEAQQEEQKAAITKESLTSQHDKFSYAIGVDVGKSLKRDGVLVNREALQKGLDDALAESEPLFSEEELRQIKSEHGKARMEARKQQREEEATKNKAASDAFLAKNKAEAGVVTLESGLQYKILTKGKGPKPAENAKVKVHYRGTLLDGKEFDSSHKRGKPAEFAVNRVVKGWTEALQLMPVGSKWQLFIPPDLGYGARGAGRDIGPEAVLVFEVELLEIVTTEEKK